MIFTNKQNLPQALCDAVRNDPYNSGGAWRSVTQLISPPRVVTLRNRNVEKVEVDYSDRLFSLYGQIVHQILERSNTVDIVEERLFADILGYKISGGYDVLQLEKGKLIDWKFSTVWKAVGSPIEWERQLNLLAYLFHCNGTEIHELEIVLMMRDHSKPRARREKDYPQHPVKRIPLPLWSITEQCRYMEERVLLHAAAETSLPQCSSEERWAKPDIFALMKEGRKSAVKLYYTKQEADAALASSKDKDKLYLKLRPGESTRCEDYCEASPFCLQFNQIKQEELTDEQSRHDASF